MASSKTQMRSSDDFRRQKELEEARKAGLAPAELDEDGKEINPHIPQYMTNAPWYLNSDRQTTLKHQRNWRHQDEQGMQWYDRGAKVFQATKWRKGACENCGSMSHMTKDCLERPRARGARWTNKHIAADDKIEEITPANWDSKRDRWNGYDPKEYEKVVDRFEQVEALRKDLQAQKQVEEIYKRQGKAAAAAAAQALAAGGTEAAATAAADGAAASVEDDARLAEEEDAAFGEVKKRVRTTAGGSTGSVRNLRIREDTAKYLLNLDLNSAYYDPKTRSMREDPQPNKPAHEKTFTGDNFVRRSGDVEQWQALNLHSMQAYEKGQDVHLQALPSLAEVMYQQFKSKKEALTQKNTTSILDKYGSVGQAPPEDGMLLAQTEAYVEYDRSGRVIRGQEVKVRSRYEEDVLVNNHTAVWGSWWHDGAWGYACCLGTVKNSYCTGRAGERAAAEVAEQMAANVAAKAAEAEAADARRAASTLSNAHLEKDKQVWGGEGAADTELDEAKLREALRRQEAVAAAHVETDERKRKYNSLAQEVEEDVTAEDMEAWRVKKARAEDPLAAFKGGKAASVGGGQYELLE